MTLIDNESKLLDMADNSISNSEEEIDENDEQSNNDSENSNKESDGSDDDYVEGANAAWADSVAKILKTKKPKDKRTLVLSKAKKLTDVVIKPKPAEVGFQIEGEIKEEKPDPSFLDKIKEETDEPPKKRKKELPSIRVKPNILDKDRERTLSKIATRGVVQLFNSVRMQQKDIDNKLEEAGSLERKRDNVMKSIDKRAFLDVLMQKKSQPVDGEVKDESKKENKNQSQKDSTWSVLRDDFMMSANLKDWDKETEEDEAEDEIEEISDSD